MQPRRTIRINRKGRGIRRVLIALALLAAAAVTYSLATGKFLPAEIEAGYVACLRESLEIRRNGESRILGEDQKTRLIVPAGIHLDGGEAEITLDGGDRIKLRGKGLVHVKAIEESQNELEFDLTGLTADGFFEKTPLTIKCGYFRIAPAQESSVSASADASGTRVSVKTWIKACDVFLPNAGTIHMDDGGSGFEKGFHEANLSYDTVTGEVTIEAVVMNRTKEITVAVKGRCDTASLRHGSKAVISVDGSISVLSEGERVPVAVELPGNAPDRNSQHSPSAPTEPARPAGDPTGQPGAANPVSAEPAAQPGPPPEPANPEPAAPDPAAEPGPEPAPASPEPVDPEPVDPGPLPAIPGTEPSAANPPEPAPNPSGSQPGPVDPPSGGEPGNAASTEPPDQPSGESPNPAPQPDPAAPEAPSTGPDVPLPPDPDPAPVKPSKIEVPDPGPLDLPILKPNKISQPQPVLSGNEKPPKEKSAASAPLVRTPAPPPLADRELAIYGEAGEIVVKRESRETVVKKGRIRLARGDVVKVRPGCYVRVNIGDGVLVTVRENTEFRMP